MDRAPNTNGHGAESVRARGGYDAYFSPHTAGGEVAIADTPSPEERSGTLGHVPGPPAQIAAPTIGAPTGMSWAQPPAAPLAAEPSGHSAADIAAGASGPAATPYGHSTGTGTAQPVAQSASAPEAPVAQPPAASGPSWVPERVDRGYYEVSRPEVMTPSLTSMDLFADIAATRRAHLRSSSGMRGALNKVGFNLGLSPAEQRTESRRGRIRRQLTATYQIAVVSVKGGVGRTTVAATLGSTFASLRPDRVVAVDANPDFGDLPTRTVPHAYGLTLRDLVRTSNLDAFSAVHSFTSVNSSDLSVLASPWTTEATEALSGREYAAAAQVLRRHYNLVLADCGTGVLDSITATVLQTSDAVVVVTPATVGGVKGAVATLNWLAAHGLQHLIASSIVAIVHHQPLKPNVEVGHIEKLFATAQRPTCVLPYDAHLAEGGEIDLRLLDEDTVLSFEELAASLADGFPSQLAGHHARDHGGQR